MARAQIKLLLFLITLGIVVGCMATVFWLYQNVLVSESKTMETIQDMHAPGRPPPDPGARRFDAAMDLVKGGKMGEARDALYRLLLQFPKSGACAEAKRIIGEMNMDALCALDASGGKKDYIVQPHDALSRLPPKTTPPSRRLPALTLSPASISSPASTCSSSRWTSTWWSM